MPEKNLQKGNALRPEVSDTLKTYSIETEQIKAGEQAKLQKTSEIKEIGKTGIDTGTIEKKEEPSMDTVEGVGYTYIPQKIGKYKNIRENFKINEQKKEEAKDELDEKKVKEELLPAKEAISLRAQQYHQEEQKKAEPAKILQENRAPQPRILNPLETHSIDTEQIKAKEQIKPLDLPKTEEAKIESAITEQKKEQPVEKNLLETYSIDTEQIKAQEIKEKANAELPQILKGINEAREKKQKEVENSFYAISPEVYREATGEELAPKVNEMAKTNLEELGKKIIKIKDYLSPERKKDTQEKIIREEQSSAILKKWEALFPEEKKKYIENGAISPNKFINEFIAQKKATTEKEKISEDAFNYITKEGFDIKKIKKRGFLGRMFGGVAIEMPTLDGSGVLTFSTKEKYKKYLEKKEFDAKDFIKKEAKKRLGQKIIEGQTRLRQEKNKCVRRILQEAIEKKELAIKIEIEQKIEAERKAKEEELKAREEEIKNSKIETLSKARKKRTSKRKNNYRIKKQKKNSKKAA